jgi:hypothetical protein
MRLAQAISGARSFWVEEMRHNRPDHLVERLLQAMIKHFEAAQGRAV